MRTASFSMTLALWHCWTGFGVLGNTDPVKSDKSYFFYLLLVLIPILGGVMYRKRKQ
jgi:hypothetical protein